MQPINRIQKREEFTFASGGTTSNARSFEKYAAAVLYIPAEFNGDTLTIKSDADGDTGFTITAATGRYNFTADELGKLFPMRNIIIVTSVATSAAAIITADFKS